MFAQSFFIPSPSRLINIRCANCFIYIKTSLQPELRSLAARKYWPIKVKKKNKRKLSAWKNEKLIRARSDLIQQHLVKWEQRPHNRSYRTHVYINKAFLIYSPFFNLSLSMISYFSPCAPHNC